MKWKPIVSVKQFFSRGVAVEVVLERIDQILQRMQQMETALDLLVKQQTVKDWYTTDEVAMIVGKAEFTVREWCRLGRIHAEKRNSGRGKFLTWVIAHSELLRFQREGLLPPKH